MGKESLTVQTGLLIYIYAINIIVANNVSTYYWYIFANINIDVNIESLFSNFLYMSRNNGIRLIMDKEKTEKGSETAPAIRMTKPRP